MSQGVLEGHSVTLSLKAAYAFGATHGLESEIAEIQNMVIEWDSSYTSSLRRGYIVQLLSERGLYDQFIAEHWPAGSTASGQRKREFYLGIKQRYEDFLAGRGSDSEDAGESHQDAEQTLEFALEAHLRDFLAKNLDQIERGLRLYSTPERSGVEFAVDGGRIDILAIDENGKFVVLELKLSLGRNKALGQLLYYMGWVDQHLGNGPCRGYIVASEITEELLIAVARVPGVSLGQYRMNFAVEVVRA
jgi:hypothetical protein